MEITQQDLRRRFTYEPHTGFFRFRYKPNNRIRVGEIAGGINPKGYWMIGIEGKMFQAHRLVWLYVYGVLPKSCIDHINLDKSDNRLSNLREATRGQNQYNRGLSKNNTTGFKGVIRCAGSEAWRARLCFERQVHYLGTFKSPEEAHLAYCKAAKQLHGEYANPG